MKASFFARAVFGLSAALFGIVSLFWRNSELLQRLHAFGVPFAGVAASIIAFGLIAGGAAFAYARTERAGSFVLGGIFGLFTLACTADIVAAPLSYASYVDFFEELSIVCGALAWYAPRATRVGFAVCTISFAWAQVAFLTYTASLVPTWIPPNGVFWTNATTLAFALAAIAILINVKATLALRLLALMVALFGLLVWIPKIAGAPGNLANASEFAENFLIASGAWLVSQAIALKRA